MIQKRWWEDTKSHLYLLTDIPGWVEIFSLEMGGPHGFFYVPIFDRDKDPENDVMIIQV